VSSGEPYRAIEAAFAAPATTSARDALSDEQRDELRRFWLGRADGELTTALSFEFMLDDLRGLGAPAVLTELAEAAVAEEHRHVDWCLRFAAFLGDGATTLPRLGGTRPLTFDGASDHDNRILRTVFGSCFSETVACEVLITSQAAITLDSVRRLNQQHIAEEVNHARLGWGLLGWPELSVRDRSMLSAFVPAMADLTRSLWCGPKRRANVELEALGYLSLPLVEAACERALSGITLPGLERSGVRV
jgi:hypothetical protein